MDGEITDGVVRSIGASRAIVLDVVQYARRVPSFPVERTVQVEQLAAARQQSPVRISWTALYLRAYALASRQNACLRQIYVPWPWPRVYQSPTCVIAVAVNRTLSSGDRLFFGRVHSPDQRSLLDIQADIERFQAADPAKEFRSQWRGAKLPWPIRKLAWWWRMEVAFRSRPRRSGTGSISALAGQGVTNRRHPCIMTSSLSFGPVGSDGNTLVTLQCDHRVIDGVAAAKAINSLCDFLVGQVHDELIELSKQHRATEHSQPFPHCIDQPTDLGSSSAA